jgi:N-acetylmuramoyl-L-alanine amidase
MMKAWWFFFMAVSALGHASTLTTLVTNNHSRVAATIQCGFSGPFHYRVFTLTHPDRVVLDLPEASSRVHVDRALKDKGLITQIRAGRPTPHTLRLVFDVSMPVTVLTRTTPGAPSALRLEFGAKKTAGHASPTAARITPPPAPRVIMPVATPHRGLRDVVIVIDPGHGGHDPGAIGSTHYVEKRVVLAIATRLKQLIDKQPGMRAVLTRKGDYYVGLRERLMIARQQNADVFISIHADAFINKQSHGASVFALSPRGATSEAARWLAEKENYSELGGVNLKGLDDKNGLIRTVLLDLSQTATVSASLQLGTQVLHDLDRMTTLHNNHVEQARFVVLKSPDTPSILVETGFISNPQEARNLDNPRYQAQLAQAIYAGLKRYFWSYPPHGSRLEAVSDAQRKVVLASPRSSRDARA